MKITFLNGSLEGKSVETEESVITIGSDDCNMLYLTDQGISSRHAYLEKIDDQWMIFDSKSTNGVFLNGQKVDKKSNINSGDTIKLAYIDFKIELTSNKHKAANHKTKIKAAKSSNSTVNSREERRLKRQKQKQIALIKNVVAFVALGILAYLFAPKIMTAVQDQRKQLVQNQEANETPRIIESKSSPKVDVSTSKTLQPIKPDSMKEDTAREDGIEQAVNTSPMKATTKLPEEKSVTAPLIRKINTENLAFGPLMESVYPENYKANYSAMLKTAKSTGSITTSQLVDDLLFMSEKQLSVKYRNKKMKVTGKVSIIREGEKVYSVVLDDLIECYIDKDSNLVSTLKSIVGQQASLTGLAVGVGGLDRVVMVKAALN